MKLKKLFLIASVIFTLCIFFGLTANAAELIDSGTCGEKLTWTFDSDGLLTISGEGKMDNYTPSSWKPWNAYHSSIKTVIISNGVTSISANAFDNSYSYDDFTSLESVTIPGSIEEIGSSAFAGCRLKNIYYEAAIEDWCNIKFGGLYANPLSNGGILYINNKIVKNLTIPAAVTKIGDYAFAYCRTITGVTIPNGIKEIGHAAFFSCPNLKNVTIPDSVTSIGDSAFGDCTSLESITIPDSVTSIGDSAFQACTGLTNVTLPDGITSIEQSTFSACINLTSITIPDSVTNIGEFAFAGCTSVESITIPKSVKELLGGAFYNCTALKSVYYTSDIESWCNIQFYHAEWSGHTPGHYFSNPLGNGGALYINNEIVEDVIIPDSVTSIGRGVFYGYSKLKSVAIGNGVTRIENNAFRSSSLESVIIPDNVIDLGSDTFAGCKQLQSVTIGNGITNIGVSFYDCTNLKSVTLPSSLEVIMAYAFNNCNKITDVYYYGMEADWENVFIDSNNDYITNATMHYLVTISADGILLDKGSINLELGTTAQLTATVTPQNATNKYVIWNSSNTAVAAVSNGKVIATDIGTATITATTADGKYSASCVVTVTEKKTKISSFTAEAWNNTSLTLFELKVADLPQKCILYIAAYTEDGQFSRLIPVSSDEIDENGNVYKYTERTNETQFKVFVWKDLSTLQPLCECAEYDI